MKKTKSAKPFVLTGKALTKKAPTKKAQPASQPKEPRTFTLKQREDLGDARLVLETAVHNLRAASGTVIDPAEAVEALETALTMTEQTIVTLRRVRNAMG